MCGALRDASVAVARASAARAARAAAARSRGGCREGICAPSGEAGSAAAGEREPGALASTRRRLGGPGLARAQIRENRVHAPVVGGGAGELELPDDMTHMGLDSVRREVEPLGDPAVRQALRHQREDLALARCELVE